MDNQRKPRILIIAQIPPPYHGQSIMQKFLVDAQWNWCDKVHLPIIFSKDVASIGKFKLSKLIELARLCIKIYRLQKKKNFDCIYYPPGGPNRIPIYRDLFVIGILKLFSTKIILHFHAGAIDKIFCKLNFIEALVVKKIFAKVDCAIVLSKFLEKEVKWIKSKKIVIVPNGIEDVALKPVANNSNFINILFVGNLKKEKGIYILLQAAVIIRNSITNFVIKLMGDFHSNDDRNKFLQTITDFNLENNIVLLGSLRGEEKWNEFRKAQIFCLPTFATEGMPISILEGMMFSLPIVSTKWRAIPDIIMHEVNGLLAEPNNEKSLANCLLELIHSDEKRRMYGTAGRETYLEKYNVEKHLLEMEDVFKSQILN